MLDSVLLTWRNKIQQTLDNLMQPTMLLKNVSPSMCDGIDLETFLEPVDTDDEDDWHR